jgi:hypothetical protein
MVFGRLKLSLQSRRQKAKVLDLNLSLFEVAYMSKWLATKGLSKGQ